MESSSIPHTNPRFTRRVSVGLLVAGGVAVGLTAPTWASSDAHPQADHPEAPVAENHTDASGGTDVHEATQAALRTVAQKAPKAELVSVVRKTVSAPIARQYRVRAHDTLSSIAQSQLGEASNYQEIFDLNKGKPQPGGGSLSDPDLIQVGWVLQLPSDHVMTPQTHPAAGPEHTTAATPVIKATALKPAVKARVTAKAPTTAKTHLTAKRQTTIKKPAKSMHTTVRKTSHAIVSGGSPQAIARSIVPSNEFGCFNNIITRESGWNVHATNPSSGAYGLPQSLPGSKMASAGPDWRDDATTQIKWALQYMDSRYGSPCDAWSFWQNHNWY